LHFFQQLVYCIGADSVDSADSAISVTLLAYQQRCDETSSAWSPEIENVGCKIRSQINNLCLLAVTGHCFICTFLHRFPSACEQSRSIKDLQAPGSRN